MKKQVEFKEILKIFLKENDFTQTKFAEAVGVKQSQVSEWLKGKAKPGYDILKQMSANLDVPADFWLGIVDTY
ncbi:MAG: helix-turn-helix transcriptional regulator [Clostridia bacterium]|nr:helix-turn-helix transcriptional regulator [Clostridia bacterium]